jgi:hypothetical protein
MILGTPIPLHENLIVSNLKFQSRITAQTDDLVVELQRGVSTEKRLIQSKKGFAVNDNKTFNEVIAAAWRDYNNVTVFNTETDSFFVTTDFLSETDSDNVLVMLDWAKFSSDSKDFFEKVRNNQSKAAKLKYFQKAIELVKGSVPTKDEVFGLLRCFYIQGYDYLSQGSKDKETLKWYLKPYLKNGVSSDLALSKLLDYIFECNQNAATLTIDNVKTDIKNMFQLTASAKLDGELFGLLKKSLSSVEHSIFNDIKGLHIDRSLIVDELITQISQKKLVVLEGDAGVGKSAVIKDAILKLYGQDYGFIFLKADLLDRESLAETLADIGITSDFDTLISRWILLPHLVIVIDSLEKLFESDKKGAFLELIGVLAKYNRVKIITTCRKYAVSSLLSKYRMERLTFATVQVPDITDDQISQVSTKFPTLKILLAHTKLKKLLRKPFYLGMAVQMTENKINDPIDEITFKESLWKFAIEKHGDTVAGGSELRARAFMSIVLKRAKEKKPYVEPDTDVKPEIIQVLQQDNILIKQEGTNAYAPAHDVLEDLAVTRHINSLYNSKANNLEFINKIEFYPVLRRGMRLWLNEKIESSEKESSQFIGDILNSKQTKQFIKDEIVLAILNSEKCFQFLDNNAAVFKEENFKQFERLILMLNVAFVVNYTGNQHVRTIKTYGPGWNAALKFINKYFLELPSKYDDKLLKIFDKASLQFELDDKLPEEAKIIAKHCLRIFENNLSDKQRDSVLVILFRVIEFALTETEELLNKTLDFNKEKDRKVETYIYRELAKTLLVDAFKYIKVYKYFPDQIITLAKMQWYYKVKHQPHQYYGSMLENSWGLKDYPSKYFNASANQTPFRYLIKFHPVKAIEFFIEITNTCIDAYSKSEYTTQHGTKQVEFTLIDGTKVKQIGDYVLWDLPRKFYSGSPDLLASLHMALEEYLLYCVDAGIDIIPYAKTLIEECKSVSVIAVLINVILKYPFAIGAEVISLLKVREFFKWDLERYGQETLNKNPSGFGNEWYYVQERQIANALPFRKNNLEKTVFILQLYGLPEINSVIDAHKANVKPNDTSWLLALQRMDMRNTEVREKIDEERIEFIPKPLPENLNTIVHDADKQRESFGQTTSVFLWADKALDKDLGIDLNYETWKAHYLTVKSDTAIALIPGIDPKTKLAAVGLRDLLKDLAADEKLYCVNIIGDLLEKVCKNLREFNSFSGFNGFEKNCYEVFPILLDAELTSLVPDKEKIKSLLIELLIFIEDESKRPLLKGLKDKLWQIDTLFSERCLIVLYNLSRKGYPKLKEIRATTNEVEKEKEFKKIVDGYDFSENESIFDLTDAENLSPDYLVQMLLAMPNDLLNDKYFTLFKGIINAAINFSKDQRENRFELFTDLAQFLANYLVENANAKSKEILFMLLKSIDKNAKFIFDVLKWFAAVAHDSKYPDTIIAHSKTIIWVIFEHDPRIGLITCLLFDSLTGYPKANKLPENKDLSNIHQCIVEQFGKEKNVIIPIFKFLSGVGSIYQPLCLQWLKNGVPIADLRLALEANKSIDFVEELVSQIYTDHVEYLYMNKDLKEYYGEILDALIDIGSIRSFRIREELI